MKKRDLGFVSLALGIGWLIVGFIIYSATIPVVGAQCGSECGMSLLWVIIPSVILILVSIILFIKKK